MWAERHRFAIDASVLPNTLFSEGVVSGRVVGMRYVPDSEIPSDTGPAITVTAEASGVAIVALTQLETVSATFVPQQATHAVTGAAALYAAAGEPVMDLVVVAGERIKVVVSDDGGSQSSGTLDIFIG